MRGAMIAIGVQLIYRFAWIIYVFGAFLIITGARMLFSKPAAADPGHNVVVRATRRLLPITQHFHGHISSSGPDRPRARTGAAGSAVEPDSVVEAARPGALLATPLLLTLIMVEFTDLIFAVDSIPAIFAITADPFLVFTSNVFAILGLRSLYFALAGIIDRFEYLKVALAVVLVIVGVKMLAHTWLKDLLGRHFNLYLLAVVLAVLLAGVVASLIKKSGRNRSKATAEPSGNAGG